MRFLGLGVVLALTCLFGREDTGLQVVGVDRTPEPEKAAVIVAVPQNGDFISSPPVYLLIRVLGFPLGTDSKFPREDEVYNSSIGQNLRIIIDDQPFFARVEPRLEPFLDQGDYYETMYKIEVPYSLEEGVHTLRVYLARSFGESLKSARTFWASTFYYQSQGGSLLINLKKPYLTYNEPDPSHSYAFGFPILLDFLVQNCELSKDGYQVRLIVDGHQERDLIFAPYYLYNLPRGRHTIELILIDRQGRPVEGRTNHVKRTIQVI
ncbi:MAG: hypothetical protein WC371_02495 [Parachlamydiales bacterium]|jgi:hypothetical protein